MKSKIVWLCAIILPGILSAQTSDNSAYAITSETIGTQEWTEVKLIDLNNGEVVTNVFENSKNDYNVYDGRTTKQITLPSLKDSTADNNKRPFAGLSAACAYDKKRNRLYYAPMFINQLRYIDLNTKTPSVYIFEDKPLSNATNLDLEANHITRMVIAADGNGYALNNDGSHLVRFTLGEMPDITDLGALHDAPTNGDVSVKDPNTSWGGDLIGDASGNLYLITSHNYVFKINVHTKVATFIHEIKTLPPGFTTNGAVVEKDGKIILSSANFITSYYSLDPSGWQATAIASNDHVFNTSDLANNNFLHETKLPETITPVVEEKVGLYPNPIRSNVFKISFLNQQAGQYYVQ
ncbi:MAG: hypothetical protein J7497_10850, partial [Chitinophagaceae bacterium]|nr:hypothetical protein [Chitinophagaceae bacterium]